MADFKRSTAAICNIKDLISGKFIKKEGWDPSYVITEYDKVMRTNILGVIVSKNNANCTLDDGTAKIVVRNFISPINAEIGDLVTVIGKPRLFNEELFINAEIIKQLKEKKWVEYRKKVLSYRQKKDFSQDGDYIDTTNNKINVSKNKSAVNQEKTTEEVIKKDEKIKKEVTETIGKAEVIIRLIGELDKGNGANINEIISKSGFDDANKLLQSLMEEGEIFQIKPGQLKVM
jgi:RPA family protein